MLTAGLPVHASDEPAAHRTRRGTLRDLLDPVDKLLLSGGDARLTIRPDTGRNAYGCRSLPEPDMPGFASSTASTISPRAFEGAERARDELLGSALPIGLPAALAARIDANRTDLLDLLQLGGTGTEVVFSASGTDAQLQAFFVARALLGKRLTSIVVAADQTGSGTRHTARGRHFGDRTAGGWQVTPGAPVGGAGLDAEYVPVPVCGPDGRALPMDEIDSNTLAAIETARASGSGVLLQVMDSSKLGVRAPSDACVDTIRRRWPTEVRIVVDACQFRLGRPRLRQHLAAGALVLLTGSKFFGGPAFSGALLVPASLAPALDRVAGPLPLAPQYGAGCDWPGRWARLGAAPDDPANLGQWLRWEAALEEMRAYYAVPAGFRNHAIAALGKAVVRALAASSCLSAWHPPGPPAGPDTADAERTRPTIFAFTLSRQGRLLTVDECRSVHQALFAADGTAMRVALGQPVEIANAGARSVGVLRLSIGARHVSESWSAIAPVAERRLAHLIDTIEAAVRRVDQLAAADDQLPTPRRANAG